MTEELTVLAGPRQGMEDQANAAEAEGPRAIEAADLQALYDKDTELYGINEVQNGLEQTIVGAGLQVMADKYGGAAVLDAMQNGDPKPTTMAEVVAKLAPEPQERESLFAAIESSDIAELGDRFNDELGGLAMGEESDDTLGSFRHFELRSIQEGKPTDSGNLLLTGNLDSLLRNHPELAEGFRQSSDTLALLKGIRDIYTAEHGQYSADLEGAKAGVEELVAKGEANVGELATLSNEVLGDEVAKLQEKMAGRNGDAASLLQSMLDQRTAELGAAQARFTEMAEAVRNQVVDELGAGRLSHLSAPAPVQPQRVWHPAEQAGQRQAA